MTDQTSSHEPEDVVHDADPDAVNVEAVNDGESVPGVQPGAGSPAGDAPSDQGVDPAAVDGASPVGTAEESADAPAETAAGAPTVSLDEHQRLMAEYVNYKRRVDRDRADIQVRAVHDVLESLLPVLDEIHLARQHGDLDDGPFRAIADKLEQVLGRHGLTQVGSKGEPFDPVTHEALMHAPWDDSDEELPRDATVTTVVTVLQPGYRAGERVLRPARVAVADPS